jgi:hypothetical protein
MGAAGSVDEGAIEWTARLVIEAYPHKPEDVATVIGKLATQRATMEQEMKRRNLEVKRSMSMR